MIIILGMMIVSVVSGCVTAEFAGVQGSRAGVAWLKIDDGACREYVIESPDWVRASIKPNTVVWWLNGQPFMMIDVINYTVKFVDLNTQGVNAYTGIRHELQITDVDDVKLSERFFTIPTPGDSDKDFKTTGEIIICRKDSGIPSPEPSPAPSPTLPPVPEPKNIFELFVQMINEIIANIMGIFGG